MPKAKPLPIPLLRVNQKVRMKPQKGSGGPSPLSISGVPPAGSLGTPYSFVPGVVGGSGTKTFALTGTLPSGLSFSTSNGSITGTPTVSGTFSGLSIAVTDSSGSANLASLSIVLAAAQPTLAPLTLSASSATVGSSFTATISGKTAGSTITLSGTGSAGLSVSGTTLSGTPTTAGAVNLIETLAGATNTPRTTSGLVTVSAPAITLSALTASPSAAQAGDALGSTISGKTSGSTLSITGAGSTGLTLSGTSITGTPTSSGSVDIIETLAGATNSPRTTSGLILITAAATLSGLTVSVSSATVAAAFSATVNGKTPGSTLSLTGPGAAGLSVSGNTISGTPTTVGTVNIVETLAGASNSPRTTSDMISVGAASQTGLVTFGSTGSATGSPMLVGIGSQKFDVEIVFSPSTADLAVSTHDISLFSIWGPTGYLSSFYIGLLRNAAGVGLGTWDNSGNVAYYTYGGGPAFVAGTFYKLNVSINPGTSTWSASIGPVGGSQTNLTETSAYGLKSVPIGTASMDPSTNTYPQMMIAAYVGGGDQFTGAVRSVKASVAGTEVVNTIASASGLGDTHGITWTLSGGAVASDTGGVTTTTYATFDAASKSTAVALSGGNLTAINSAASGVYSGVRSDLPISGKGHVEWRLPSVSSADLAAFGLVEAAYQMQPSGTTAPTGSKILCWNGDGIYGTGGISIVTDLGWTGAADWMSMDWDLTGSNRLVWFLGPSGLYNNNASANPATGVGGLTIPAGTFYVGGSILVPSVGFAANFGASAFSRAVPSGYNAGLYTQTTGGGGTVTPPTGTTAIDSAILAAAGQPTLDKTAADTYATIKAGSPAGTLIRDMRDLPAAISSISPSDGRIALANSGTQLRCGATATANNVETVYTLNLVGGGTKTLALASVAGVMMSTYGWDDGWWTTNYQTWLGITSPMLSPHGAYDSASGFVESINQEIGAPGFYGARCFTAPLVYNGVTLAQAAAGAMDATWDASFAKILRSDQNGGLGHQTKIYIRPGCEANLGNWPWNAIMKSASESGNGISDRENYKTVFARYVTRFRAYDTANRAKFVFCPVGGVNVISADDFTPDMQYVDAIGTDLYYMPAFGFSTDPVVALAQAKNCTNGLDWVINLANANGKEKCLPEWSCGVEGFGSYIKGVKDYCEANNFSYITWWESLGDYQSQLAYGNGFYHDGTPFTYGDVAAKQGDNPENGAMYRFLANPIKYPTNPLTRPGIPGIVAIPGNGQVTLSVTPGRVGTGGATTQYVLYRDNQPGVGFQLTSGKFVVDGLTNGQSYNFKVAAQNASGIGFKSAATSAVPTASAAPAVYLGSTGSVVGSPIFTLPGSSKLDVDVTFVLSASDLQYGGNGEALVTVWGSTGYTESFYVGLLSYASGILLATHDNSGNIGYWTGTVSGLVAGTAYQLQASINPATSTWTAKIGPAGGTLNTVTAQSAAGLSTVMGGVSTDPGTNEAPALRLGTSPNNLFQGSIRKAIVSVGGVEKVNTTASGSSLTDTHGITWTLSGGALVA